MRRSQLIIAATMVGTAGTLAFHPTASTVQAVATTTKPATSASATSTSSAGTSGTGSDTPSGTSTSSRTSATSSGSATGEAISTRYGNVQVRVTVSNGKITNIQAVVLTDSDARSVQISASAEPLLKQETLTKQTANIDAVSGATYTSAAYAQSLQSALNKLGFKAAGGAVATLQVPS